MSTVRLSIVVIIQLMLMLCALPSMADDAQPLTEKEKKLLQAIADAQASIQTLRANFEQIRTSTLFTETLHSEGSFSFQKPDALYWHNKKPQEFVLLAAKGEVSQLDPKTNRSKKASSHIGFMVRQILSWMSLDFSRLSKDYRIEIISDKAPVQIRLVPLSAQMSKVIDSITLTFYPAGFLVHRVILFEKSGDQTMITFTQIEVNPILAKGLFSL